MSAKIIIVNDGPDSVEVAVTGQPIYVIGKGQHQEQQVFEGEAISIRPMSVIKPDAN